MHELISLEEAQNLVLAAVSPGRIETIPLASCLNRVLAETIIAQINVPAFDRSALDGYAMVAEGHPSNEPLMLKVTGEVPAGYFSDIPVQPGAAVRILTGAPLPPGANVVVRQEDVSEDKGIVKIHKPQLVGAGISRAGEDIQAGEKLFSPGIVIDPAIIGILASQGITAVKVYVRPRIAVASTGDELVELGEKLLPGQIYNTNLYTLAALIETWGGQPEKIGLVKDKVADLTQVIANGLDDADLVVTTGGASVGTYDIAQEAMLQAGAEVLFWRVAMKPGTPVICARKEGKLIIGLSGNPAASMISAALILGPAVRKLSGFTAVVPRRVTVKLLNSFSKLSGVRRLVRSRMFAQDGHLVVGLKDQQQPGVLKSMFMTNVLVDLPPGKTLQAGESCQAFILNAWEDPE